MRVEGLCGAGWLSLLCFGSLTLPGLLLPCLRNGDWKTLSFLILSSTKHRLGGLDKLTSHPGHKLCCQNVVSPPTLTSPGNLTLDGPLHLAAQLGGHDGQLRCSPEEAGEASSLLENKWRCLHGAEVGEEGPDE